MKTRAIATFLLAIAALSAAFADTLPSTAYVKDGLVVQYDGIDNAGRGLHEAAITAWKDLTGNGHDLPLNEGDVVGADRVSLAKASRTASNAVFSAYSPITIDYNARPTAMNTAGNWNAPIANIPNIGCFGWDGRNGAISVMRPQSATATAYNYRTYNSGYTTLAQLISAAVFKTYTASPGYGKKNSANDPVYVNAALAAKNGSMDWDGNTRSSSLTLSVGSGNTASDVRSIRIYNRVLTATEVAINTAVDKARFDGAELSTVLPGYHYSSIFDRVLPDGYEGTLVITGSPENVGEPVPAYGNATGLADGATLAVSAPAWTNAEETVAATCVGWTIYDENGAVISNGTGNAFTYVHSSPAMLQRLKWHWTYEYKVKATAGAGGSVSPAAQWVPEGGNATVTAAPDASSLFVKWTGDIPSAAKYDAVATFSVSAPGEVLANFVAPGGGATWHWTGAGANALASTPANWAEGTAPTELASVVFDEQGEGKPCTWDLDIPLQSWLQTNYTSTVTFRTVYAENGFSKLRILGDCALHSGKWTHLANGTTYRQYRLYASVGGNMTIGTNATIDVSSLGYTKQYRVSDGAFVGVTFCGGTYCGYGRWNSGTPHANGIEPYGSITAPEDPGSAGANTCGGGVLRLDVAGALSFNGTILSNGKLHDYYTGSGGSVYLRAGTISGIGTITANGRTPSANNGSYSTGTGGRIAIILTAPGATFSAFDPVRQCTAISITKGNGTNAGAPGTIYAETPADTPGRGWLIFKDNGATHSSKYTNANPFTPDTTLADFARITVTNNARIYIAPGDTLDLRNTVFEAPDTSGVYLDGGTLKPAAGGNIYYDVTTAAGLGGLDAPSVAFHSGSSLEIVTAAATYTGDMAIDSGILATVATSLTVDGDLALNGTIRRPDGPFNTDPKTLDLHVTGDMTIGATGSVTMSGRGYSSTYCPPDQTASGNAGSSHGGRGWGGNKIASRFLTAVVPYGSVTEPATAGAGGSRTAGGGIVKLVVDGDLVNDGGILAEAGGANYYTGAGGSVNVRAGTLSGSGRISADSKTLSNEYGPAGGGRVAVRLTSAGADFSDYTGEFSARGSRLSDTTGKWVGGAGTVWLRTAAQDDDGGALLVDNMFPGLVYYGDTTVGGTRVEGTSFGDVLVLRSARLNLANDAVLHVSGVLSNGCEFVAGNNSTVDFTGAGESRVYGDIVFSNLTCNAAGKTITVDDGATITLKGLGAFEGAAGSPITIRSATAGEPWTLNVTESGSVVMNGVALRDCQSTVEIIVMNGTDLGGNSANIIFNNVAAGELMTWTGAEDTSWATPGNWDRQRAPIATDRILIPSSAQRMPVLAANSAAATLTVQQGASLALADRDLSITGDVSIAGAFIASATEVFSVGGNLSLSDASTPAQSIVRLTGAAAQTVTSSGATLYAIEVANPTVFFTNDIACTSFSVGDATSAFDLSFANGMTLTANTFAAHGDPTTTNGVLRCATDGGTWHLTVNESDVSGAAVKGSDASRGVTIVPSDCRDDGGNVNWLFVDDRTHWDGTTWSRGEPTASIDAVVDSGASLTVASPLAAHNFTVSSGASVRITSSFEATGAMTLENNATVTWDAPGAVGGNLVLLPGATLTHTANTTKETYKIDLTVGGSGYVAEGAKISATAKGYSGANGPGYKDSYHGCSYAGRAYTNDKGTGKPCYGSALCPTNSGSGGVYGGSGYPGGGAIKIAFAGPLVLDGSLAANGYSTGSWYSGAGGSIWLTASSLSGSGAISACGGNTTNGRCGSGGRVAIYLTEATSTETFIGTIDIHGGIITETDKTNGSPGTYYLQTAADAPGAGVLTSYSRRHAKNSVHALDNATEIAPTVHAREGETRRVRVTASADAYLTLAQDTTIADIHLLDSTARLYLKGYTLRVKTRRHVVSPNDASQIIYDGGEIVWNQPTTVIFVR